MSTEANQSVSSQPASVFQTPKTEEIQSRCECCMCKKINFFNSTSPRIKTTRLCVLILQSLQSLKPSNEYFSLKNDINAFINDHWDLLVKLKQFQNSHWRKALLDAFNHCSLIESGKDVFHNRGYYRLKQNKNEIPKTDRVETQNLLTQIYHDLQVQLNHSNHLLVASGLRWMGPQTNKVNVSCVISDHNAIINNLQQFKNGLCYLA
ncbi:H15 domain-containing protein [Entamoeba marina]